MLINGWSGERRALFAEDWARGLSHEGLARRYDLPGAAFHAVTTTVGLLGLPPRSRTAVKRLETRRTRKCLKCGRGFPSGGAGNRICRPCKATEGWRDPGDYTVGGGVL